MQTEEITVAALYIAPISVYKAMPGVDPWDEQRDARGYAGPHPVIAHPPCAQWARLRHWAKPNLEQRDLALIAVGQVRCWQGVLEHPEASALWPEAGLPLPGPTRDEYGGWSLSIDQLWFGHQARKRTWLYIVGIEPSDLPRIPLSLERPQRSIAGSSKNRNPPTLHGNARAATPPAFAQWLYDLASKAGSARR